MNYRLTDKQYLKTYLETVTFDGKALPVYTKHTISDHTPYCLVSSAGLIPNDGANTLHDTGHYKRGYRYQIHLAWLATLGEAPTQVTEDSIDELEASIIDLLQSQAVRDCEEVSGESPRTAKWLDLSLDNEVSAPMSGLRIALSENHFIKTFFVKIQHETDYV
jgi:hypothetical protein